MTKSDIKKLEKQIQKAIFERMYGWYGNNPKVPKENRGWLSKPADIKMNKEFYKQGVDWLDLTEIVEPLEEALNTASFSTREIKALVEFGTPNDLVTLLKFKVRAISAKSIRALELLYKKRARIYKQYR